MNELKSTGYKLGDDPIIRFCTFYVTMYVGSLILGGFGIFLIVLGLLIFFTRALSRTSVGQTYASRLFGFKQPEQIVNQPHSAIYKIATTGFRLIMFGFYTTASIYLIWIGIKFLLDDGFLNQNLIYMLFFR